MDRKEYKAKWYAEHREELIARRSERYYKNKKEELEIKKKYAASHPEKIKAIKEKWANSNKEKILAYREYHKEETRERVKKWRENNLDKVKEYMLKYIIEHPEVARASNQTRRARKKGNGGKVTYKQWNELCEKFGNICLKCGESKPLTMDHIVPISRGGSSSIDNLQPLCLSCNKSKFTKTIDYRSSLE